MHYHTKMAFFTFNFTKYVIKLKIEYLTELEHRKTV